MSISPFATIVCMIPAGKFTIQEAVCEMWTRRKGVAFMRSRTAVSCPLIKNGSGGPPMFSGWTSSQTSKTTPNKRLCRVQNYKAALFDLKVFSEDNGKRYILRSYRFNLIQARFNSPCITCANLDCCSFRGARLLLLTFCKHRSPHNGNWRLRPSYRPPDH